MNSNNTGKLHRETSRITDLVWIQTSFIGDIVLSTGAFRLARECIPGVRQHVVTTGPGERVLAGSTSIDSLTTFRKSGLGFGAMNDVRARIHGLVHAAGGRQDSTVTLLPHRSFRSGLLARRLGYRSIAYADTPAGLLATETVPRVAVLHETSRVALLLEPLGAGREEILAARPHLDRRVSPPLSSDVKAMAGIPANPGWLQTLADWPGRVIGVVPGSKWGTKRWTPAGFVQLISDLLVDPDNLVVLICADDERVLCGTIAEGVHARGGSVRPVANLVNLAGATTLDELRSLYPELDLIVTNDSSSIHYASAFNVPTVAVFGATVPAMGFGPLASRSASVGIDLSCRPCSDHGPEVCPLGHFRCMKDLAVSKVLQTCRDILAM